MQSDRNFESNGFYTKYICFWQSNNIIIPDWGRAKKKKYPEYNKQMPKKQS